jgi:hypothetical protein
MNQVESPAQRRTTMAPPSRADVRLLAVKSIRVEPGRQALPAEDLRHTLVSAGDEPAPQELEATTNRQLMINHRLCTIIDSVEELSQRVYGGSMLGAEFVGEKGEVPPKGMLLQVEEAQVRSEALLQRLEAALEPFWKLS